MKKNKNRLGYIVSGFSEKPCCYAFLFFVCYLSFFSSTVLAEGPAYLTKIETLLKSDKAPEGIVFEIINRNVLFLNWAMPEVAKQSERLRKKFPDLDIAVVSHGREMFALTAVKQSENLNLKTQVDSLVSQQIPVYVCGTYAERKGVSDAEFPENIRVAAEGPSQIKDYINLGYTHILLNMN
ncbi:MAG: DsrE family protein [Gammaproteobacteria bacterium]|nr:DsrE family protein [Gammaproteobacteria bacterium]MCW8909660.1 DsrE family protein [Gammaproteobacteria bacterium]MCW9004085.1 DsrE family protein [Gammaproteobacteria bacterium]MCW9055992.1 DsrE family protein [Gammaproteobacteria bacterium]